MRTAPTRPVRRALPATAAARVSGPARVAWWLLLLHLALSPLAFSLATVDAIEEPKVALLGMVALVLTGLGFSVLLAYPAACSSLAARLGFFDPVTLGFLSLAGSALVSTACSVSPATSWRGSTENLAGTSTILGYLVLYLATRLACRDVGDGRRLLAAAVFATGAASAYGLMQSLHRDPVTWSDVALYAGQVRPFATLGHTNCLGAYLVMTLPLLAAWLLQPGPRGRWARLLLGLTVVPAAGVVVLTLSRAAWLAGACAVVLLAAALWPRVRRVRLVPGVVVLTGLTALGAVWLAGPGAEVRARLTERVRHLTDGEGRNDIWGAAWQLFLDRPLCGWGTDCFRLAFGRHRPVSLWQTEGEATPAKAHNELLQVLATQGLLGGASVALLAFGLVRGAVRAWRLARPADRPLVIGVAASVLAFAVQNLFGFTVVGLGGLFVTCAALLSRWGDPSSAGAPVSGVRSLSWGLLTAAVSCVALFACNFGLAYLPLALLVTGAGAVPALAVLRLEAGGRRQEAGGRRQKAEGRGQITSWLLPTAFCLLPSAFLLLVGVARPLQSSVACHKGERLLADDPVAALSACEQAVALDPGNDRHWNQLAETARLAAGQAADDTERGRLWLRAREALERARDLVPADPYHHANLGRLLAELSLAGWDTPTAALEEWQKALSDDPINPRFLIEAGRTALGVGERTRARQYLTRGLSLYPAYPGFQALLGACALAEGNRAEAVTRLDTALRGDWHGDAEDRDRAVATLTAAHLGLGHAQQALGLAGPLVGHRPQWPMAWYLFAQAQEALGRAAQAREAYRHVLALDPRHAEAARALQRLGGP